MNKDHELLKWYIPAIIKHLEKDIKEERRKKLDKINGRKLGKLGTNL